MSQTDETIILTGNRQTLLAEYQNCFFDNITAIHQLILRHNQRRRKTNNIAMRWLGKQAIIS